jgi:hypothetical protein
VVIIREIVACGPITIAPEVPNAVALVLRVENSDGMRTIENADALTIEGLCHSGCKPRK